MRRPWTTSTSSRYHTMRPLSKGRVWQDPEEPLRPALILHLDVRHRRGKKVLSLLASPQVSLIVDSAQYLHAMSRLDASPPSYEERPFLW